MFEAAEIGAKVSKQDYEAALPQLRTDLINAQFDLKKADFPVLMMLAGDDRVGCNEVLNILHEWMDARYLQTSVFGEMSEEERSQPRFWRLWRALPGRGEFGIFAGSWATETIDRRLREQIDDAQFDRLCGHTQGLEKLLVARRRPGAQVLDPPPQAGAARGGSGRRTSARAAAAGRSRRPIAASSSTTTTRCPGCAASCVSRTGAKRPGRSSRAATIDTGICWWPARCWSGSASTSPRAPRRPRRRSRPRSRPLAARQSGRRTSSTGVDLDTDARPTTSTASSSPSGRDSSTGASTARARKGITSVLVFEGWDAAGKGGVIRRITGALDAGEYHLVPIAAPTDEERAHHYLWRFWRRLPRGRRGRDLRPQLVRPRAGRARRGLRARGRPGGAPTRRSTTSRRTWSSGASCS